MTDELRERLLTNKEFTEAIKGTRTSQEIEDTIINAQDAKTAKIVREATLKEAIDFIESYLVTTVHPEGDMHHIDDREWQSVKLRLLKSLKQEH